MKTYIALLRGINVGGKGLLPMKELVAILDAIGSQNVKTYNQSGNAVFQHDETDASRLAKDITAKIAKKRGFAPHVLVLEAKEFRAGSGWESVPGSGGGAEVAARVLSRFETGQGHAEIARWHQER